MMNTSRKNRTALRPTLIEARLEQRLALSHAAATVAASFVVPKPMITIAPLTNITTPIVTDYGTGSLVRPRATVPVSPLTNINTPVVIDYGSVVRISPAMVPTTAHSVGGLLPPPKPGSTLPVRLPNLRGPIFY
jgi:hypothetical protein